MKTWLCVMTAILLLSLPAQAGAANFAQAATETSKDLKQAQQEQQATQMEIASTLEKLESGLAGLESRLKSEREGLAGDQEELGRLSRLRAELSRELAEKSGDLKELTGHVRAAARDLLTLAENSPVSAEHPGRLETLRGYLNPGYFPGLKEIKNLVELYLEEISANGRVLKRRGLLVNRAGEEIEGEIVRLGGFTTLYRAGEESGFLALGPASGRLLAISGEPPWDMAGPLEDFIAGTSASAPVDISGGAALRQLSRRVGLWKHLESGGPLIYPILAVGLLGLLLALERFWFLQRVRANTDQTMNQVNKQVAQGDLEGARETASRLKGRPTGNVLLAGLKLEGCSAEVVEGGLAEAMLRELPRLERFLTALKVLAAVAPLLGLLGTVTGMINTFHVITVFGTGDPRLMAGGISEALVTTQLGLAVAIPLLVIASLLSRKAQRITGDMEEKSVALSAALIDRRMAHAA